MFSAIPRVFWEQLGQSAEEAICSSLILRAVSMLALFKTILWTISGQGLIYTWQSPRANGILSWLASKAGFMGILRHPNIYED